MTEAVTVVIAYRDMGDPHRRRSFAWVRAHYETLGWPVIVEAGDSDATFTRASAINAAVRRAKAGVIVQSDPDSVVPPARLEEAVRLATQVDRLVIPHDRYLYLTEQRTDMVINGALDIGEVGPADCEFHGPDGMGNVVVFHRRVWETVGGLDERFGLWGGDDAALGYACEALCGPIQRLPGDMVHLWHPRLPQSEPGHPEYVKQFAFLAEYRDAAAVGPEAVRAIVRGQ